MKERPPSDGSGAPPDGVTSRFLAGVLAGDLQALDGLVERLTPLLLSLARYRLRQLAPHGHEPMDLVQDVWLRTLPHLHRLVPRDGRLVPVLMEWLGVTMRRRVRDILTMALRRQAAVPTVADGTSAADLQPATRDVVTRVLERERRDLVGRAIEALPLADREVVLLRGIEQLPFAEVAAALGLQEGAAKMRYVRALERLRAELPGSVFDDFPG
jgi:RNA polymerase sigma-70 factor (ECF subfamily)